MTFITAMRVDLKGQRSRL